jgi:hypothetical protein
VSDGLGRWWMKLWSSHTICLEGLRGKLLITSGETTSDSRNLDFESTEQEYQPVSLSFCYDVLDRLW